MTTLPRPAVRRPISITTVSVVFFVLVALTPVVLPITVVADLVTRAPMRRTRVWLLYLSILFNEGLGTWSAIAMTAFHLGRLDRPLAQERFHRLMMWWGERHITSLRRFAGLRWVVETPDEVVRADAIVLSRHSSHADSVLPLLLFGTGGGHHLRYTLKDDLQWAPAMDIVGNRMPHVFVDRSPDADSPLTDRIRELARGVDDDTVAVIFPEGTFYTPARLDRAATRIAETRPDLEATVRSLQHLLPPRPAGTLALMEGAPGADLVLVAHEGMEDFGDLAAIRANIPLTHPVRVRLWRIARADVPDDEDDFVTWLMDRWIDMDRWIQQRVVERRTGSTSSLPPGQEFRP
ncbi:MAG: lysophospholipid acyltransferase family protein [Acidimicrobiales bacterium]